MVERCGIKVIDLFSGAGGFSEGFRQAGFDVIMGIDNWKPACKTHELNGFGECRTENLLGFGVDSILNMKRYLDVKHEVIDIIIGSPPCTEFSYAKKAGKGDLEKGMLLVREHMLFVTLLKPKFWLMENVPRLEQVLDKECEGSQSRGWDMPYDKLGITDAMCKKLGMEGDALHIPNGVLLTASDFGSCENRKRFIAGCFPVDLLEEQKVNNDVDVGLGGLLGRFEDALKAAGKDGYVKDLNYPHHNVKRNEIRDYDYDTSVHSMYWEEMRFLKRRNIQYGKMSFPEDLGVPARTVMATFTSSSRESLVFDTGRTIRYHGKQRPIFRQPTVREVACIQGFPLSFQFAAQNIGDRYKLVGNAVPCQMAYALAKTISHHSSIEKSTQHNTKEFFKRLENTVKKQRKNRDRPLIYPPETVVDEAVNLEEVHSRFRAKPTKHLRRKMLSSKLEADSSVVIFENTDSIDGKIVGGPNWKSCLQVGVGESFYRVYLDEQSVSRILQSFDSILNPDDLKPLLGQILRTVEKGIPVLRKGWIEFPGWLNGQEKYLSCITGKYLQLPGASMFQKMFTSDIPDIGNVAGPIDFFDGLDATMLTVFSKEEYKHLPRLKLYLNSLKDSGSYADLLDSRIIPQINNAQIPLVTLMGSMLSVHVLRMMYEKDKLPKESKHSMSLRAADEAIIKWCVI